jgi:DNA-directed RNA polymerase omega subunit
MSQVSIEDFEGKCDSLYKLVIAAARRATQISRPDIRPLIPVASHKPTMVALGEILEGKVKVEQRGEEEEGFLE